MKSHGSIRSLVGVSILLLATCAGAGDPVLATQQARLFNPEFPGAGSFVGAITNPYMPLPVGQVMRYRSETDEGVETTVVEVTSDTKVILGVTTRVVRDRVYLDGSLIEDTFDWFAQDSNGNVWYLGEDSKEIENGQVVSTEGSWEAGVDGAQPGIVMPANPRQGMSYAQEFAPGVAEDHARVINLRRTVVVPAGTYANCLQTRDWTPLEPSNREFKYYAPNVGLVLETHGRQRNELISIEQP